MTAAERTAEVHAALRFLHSSSYVPPEWIYAEEVRVAPGWYHPNARPELAGRREQRLDAVAFHSWPSAKFERIVYEVKASRTDLRKELDAPWKAGAGLHLSNRFVLAVHGDVNLDGLEIPDEWGLYRIIDGRIRVERLAPWRNTPEPPYTFMLSLARTIQKRIPR